MNTKTGMQWLLRRLASIARPAARGAQELRAMSDYELKDLGIGRSEVGYTLGEADRALQTRHGAARTRPLELPSPLQYRTPP